MGGRLPTMSILPLCVFFLMTAATMAAAAETAQESSSTPARVDLPQAGHLLGRLLDAPAEPVGPRKSFFWQSPAFARPFEFALDGVVGIRFPTPADNALPTAAGAWRIELVGGDQLVGDVVSIDDRQVVARIGAADAAVTVAVRREAVKGLFRVAAGANVVGTGGLVSWRQMPPDSWRESGGRLVSGVSGATLFRDLEAGPRARYDLSLSWEKPPTLQLAVGVAADQKTPGGYRLEFGPAGLVAVREEAGAAGGGAGRADLEPCGAPPQDGLALTLFVDQIAGRLVVMLPDAAEPVADLTIPPAGGDGRQGGGVRIGVVTGEVSLDALRVSPWRGGAPAGDDTREGTIKLRDGESLEAVVAGMQQAADMLTVRDAGGATRSIPVAAIEEIVFPPAAEEAGKASPLARPSLRAVDLQGSRLTGNLLRVERGAVWLEHPSIDDPVPVSIGSLVSLTSTTAAANPGTTPGRLGRLACDEGRLWGCLVKGNDGSTGEAAGASAIAWRPLGSLTASPLAMRGDGGQPQATITYVESQQGAAPVSGGAIVGGIGGHIGVVDNRPAVIGLIAGSPAQRAGIQGGEMILAIAPRGDGRFVETAGLAMEDVQHLLRGRVGSTLQLRLQGNGQGQPREIGLVREPLPQFGGNPQLLDQALQAHDRLLPPAMPQVDQNAADWFGSLLILRTGETIACRVESIDERGVRLQLPGSEPVVVAGDLVQALELVPSAVRPVTTEKFRSLTMLPRSQRQQPPTHVLRSIQGDYLRGRLVSMDEQTARIAVEASPRGKPLAIPRADVARLIWLHPENLETPWEPPQPPTGSGLFVEGVGGKDHRLRLLATGIDGNLLLGRSPVVGPCRIDLEKTDRLAIGAAGTTSQPSLPYAQWKLQPAPEPRNLPPRDTREP
mgnify:CR=1 FL=1